MRSNPFVRSLVSAALAAGLYPATALLLRPVLDPYGALALHVALSVGAHLAALAATRRDAARGLALGVALTGVAAGLAMGPRELAFGAALALAIVRSAVLFRARPARAVAIEAALGIAGLVLASGCAAPGLAGTALAIWAFFLVQSLYPLLGGVTRRSDPAGADPFEVARGRLEEWLRG
jgi:hypothetical protein